jgi:EpsI family protein
MPEAVAPILRSRAAIILTAVLVLQAAVTYGFSRKEVIAPNKPLASVPHVIGDWQMISESRIEKDVLDVLRADETLSRSYASTEFALSANLFIAYFRSQRTGQAPHSPKNCLPGSGWTPSVSEIVPVDIPGRGPIEVNRYIVAKGDQKSVVVYWYQSRDRVVADEYSAKFYVVADALRYNRTDTALVRVIVPVVGNDEAASIAVANKFVQDSFNTVRGHFPA